MSDDRKSEFLAQLREEEAATVESIAFWMLMPQSEIMGPKWVQEHVEGLKVDLEEIKKAIEILVRKV